MGPAFPGSAREVEAFQENQKRHLGAHVGSNAALGRHAAGSDVSSGRVRDRCRCSATLLRKASRHLSQLYDGALAPAGITSTQFALLVEIARWGETPPTLGELAAAMVMDRSGLGHGLRPLEREGMVALTEGRPDRRVRHIVLTVKGNTVLRRAKALWKRAEAHVVAVLGSTVVADLQSRLRSIAHEDRFTSMKKRQ
jgi:DNA-binding MarR family transcriptional regulator